MALRILAEDIVRFRDADGNDVATLFWGDRVEQVGDGNQFELTTTEWDDELRDYKLVKKTVRARRQPRFQDEGVLLRSSEVLGGPRVPRSSSGDHRGTPRNSEEPRNYNPSRSRGPAVDYRAGR